MEDRDFRVGDKVTCLILGHGEVVDDDGTDHCSIEVRFKNSEVSCYARNGKWEGDDDFGRVLFHGHLDLEDIQRYIESKEQIPVRTATKYLNIFLDDFEERKYSLWNKELDAKNAVANDAKYICIAQPIEVTE